MALFSDDDAAPTRRSSRRRPASASGPPKLVALPDDYRPSAPKKRKLKGKEHERADGALEVSDENTPVADEPETGAAHAEGEHRVCPPRVSAKAPTVSRQNLPPPFLARTAVAAESFRKGGRRWHLSPIKSNSNSSDKASCSSRADVSASKGVPRARMSPSKQNLRKSTDAPRRPPLGDFIDTSPAPSVAKSIQKRLFSAFASPSEGAPPSAGKRARLIDHREKGGAANDMTSAFSRAADRSRSFEVRGALCAF